MQVNHQFPYLFPLGRQVGQSGGWHIGSPFLTINPQVELICKDPEFIQIVQPATTVTLTSQKGRSETTERVILNYINDEGVKQQQIGTLATGTGAVVLTDEKKFKYVESMMAFDTVSGDIILEASGSQVYALDAFARGSVIFHRFTGNMTTYITQWWCELLTASLSTETVEIELRFYHDYNDCLHEDAPYYVLDSTVLRLEAGSSVRYHRQFHPTMPLPPYGYFAAFANSQNVDAYISMYMQGYDVFPI